MGFIWLVGRENQKVPRLAFDYSRILVRMRHLTYAHRLEEARA